MKRLKMLGVLLLAGLLMAITSCRHNPFSSNYDSADSAQVAQFVESCQNPDLMSVPEVIELQNQMLEIAKVDSAFKAMSTKELTDVSSVLLKKRIYVRKKDIVEEFRLHKDIYENLPTTESAQNDKEQILQASDLGNRHDSVFSTSYKFRTDTINGKPVRIKIKTEESYE